MFKPLSTKEIRLLSSVTRYRAERKRPLSLILTIAIAAALFIGYFTGSYLAESEAKSNCEITKAIR
jgi:hypothetical protein